jgi:hypothetical protein
MVVMYAVMFVSSYELSHIRFSQSRMFMALSTGGTMGLIMLGFMLNMYRHVTGNWRSSSRAWCSSARAYPRPKSDHSAGRGVAGRHDPHRSMAITRSEQAELSDVRVCRPAADISEAQRREIAEMEWLIEDIERNGVAATAEERRQGRSRTSPSRQSGSALAASAIGRSQVLPSIPPGGTTGQDRYPRRVSATTEEAA